MQDQPLHSRLSWDDLRVFLALSRSGSLSEAGRRVLADGSTMSRRLDGLERDLGSILFERGRDGIVMTEAGRQLKPLAEEMEHLVARFAGTVETFEREVAGVVRIASPGDAAQHLVVPLLPELLEKHPQLRIELVPGEAIVDLRRHEAELALRTLRPESGDLVSTRLRSLVWKLAAHPGLASQLGPVSDLSSPSWIGCGPMLSRATPGRFWSANLNGIEPTVVSDSLTVQISCARAGLGIALLPQPSIAPSGLVEVELCPSLKKTLHPWPEDSLYLIAERAMRRVPRVAALWEHLRERVGDATD